MTPVVNIRRPTVDWGVNLQRSVVAHPTDKGGYPVRQLPPLMLSYVAAVERSQPQAPTAPTPTADPKLISNSSKRKGSMGRGGTGSEDPPSVPSYMSVYREKRFRSR
ncbi:Uncharacterized protein DBV15_01298, partial [Temnothorax longispinosus]